MDNYAKYKLQKKIGHIVNRRNFTDRKIIIFGASTFSKEIKNCLLDCGLKLDAIIDNDSRKIGRECMGLTIQTPQEVLVPFHHNKAIFFCSAGFYKEMAAQLTQLGYKKDIHFFILNFKTNESIHILLYFLARAIRGAYTYRFLKKKYPASSTLFIAPYTGMGDIYLIGLFFQEYLRKNNIADYLFLVVSGACKKVAEMFGIRNIVVIEPRVADDIINHRVFLHDRQSVCVLNDGWLGEPLQWLRGYKGLHFEEVFRRFVFDIDGHMAHKLPPSCTNNEEIDRLFTCYNLERNKTVVLSPYSNTLFELPEHLWGKIVNICEECGYEVCTNCASATEKPVEGTTGVFIPLGLMPAFMSAAGFFIGIRSGLCDVISASTCRKIILYERDGFFYTCSPFSYFSLKKMGLCDDAIELEYHSSISEKILDRIRDALMN